MSLLPLQNEDYAMDAANAQVRESSWVSALDDALQRGDLAGGDSLQAAGDSQRVGPYVLPSPRAHSRPKGPSQSYGPADPAVLVPYDPENSPEKLQMRAQISKLRDQLESSEHQMVLTGAQLLQIQANAESFQIQAQESARNEAAQDVAHEMNMVRQAEDAKFQQTKEEYLEALHQAYALRTSEAQQEVESSLHAHRKIL